jgi:hypothetical protein
MIDYGLLQNNEDISLWSLIVRLRAIIREHLLLVHMCTSSAFPVSHEYYTLWSAFRYLRTLPFSPNFATFLP